MSIDSRNKRASASSLVFAPNFPLADGEVTGGDKAQAAGVYGVSVWTSPDSHNVESETDWNNCANAYDDDTATYADENAPGTQQPLELHFSSPIVTDRCRIYAVMEFKGDEIDPTLKIYAWVNDDWLLVDSGEIPKNAWYEHYIYKSQQDVYVLSKIKIVANAIADYELRVCEFNLLDVSGNVTFPPRTKVSASLARPVLISKGLVA